jgi:predicted secreted Zn-dependent protease
MLHTDLPIDNITPVKAREMITLYMNAECAVLQGQAYQIAGQSLTRADLDKIRKGRQEWQNILNGILGKNKRRFRQITPVDN